MTQEPKNFLSTPNLPFMPPAVSQEIQDKAAADDSQVHTASADSAKSVPSSHIAILPLQSFGEQFRSRRADLNITIEALEASTKVRANLIRSLEDGTYSQQRINPHFLTAQVELLCLGVKDEDHQLLDLFMEELEQKLATGEVSNPETSLIPHNAALSNLSSRHDSSKLPGIIITIITVLLAVLIISAYMYQKYNATESARKIDSVDLNLPQLIKPSQMPLETLPVPTN